MVRALIRCSVNCCTCPGLASAISVNTSVHSASLFNMQLDHVAQVDEIIGGAELGEPNVLYRSIDSASVFLSGSLVRSHSKLCLVIGESFLQSGLR
jgi:hypothetical protein